MIGRVIPRPVSIVWITAAIATLAGLIGFGLFIAASRSVLPGDPGLFRARIAVAFATGKLVENYDQEGSTTIGSHQWNDCLILVMASDQRGDLARLALSPILMDLGPEPSLTTNPCAVLGALNRGATPNGNLYYYDRYPNGAVILLRALLPYASITRIRTINRATQSTLLLLGLALALAGLARRRDATAFTVIAISSLALMRYFGLESFSQSLGHGPADAVIAAYLVTVAAMAFAPAGLTLTVLAAAVFGVLTMIFELFTGGIPIGLAMVIGLAPLVASARVRPVVASSAGGVAFLSAGAIFYFAKMLATMMTGTGGLAGDATSQVLRLTIFDPYGELSGGRGPAFAIHETIRSIDALTGGMWLLSAGTLAIAALAGGYGLWRLRQSDVSPALREKSLLLALSAAIPGLWCLFFLNLMIEHAWFTDRVFVWPIAVGFGLFALALVEERGSGHIATTTIKSKPA
ncbi:hypothetical protein [Sphingomonas sp.]|uniref:hypothetical protein n=1 Tax=Sphingomonas sp. TaxID=28214 RepID=UPI0025E0EE8F|nr:hypothetical protein [Sphingomonas sp.]MBV9526957.1 hypothetical protein [Sphingomonas sp.]